MNKIFTILLLVLATGSGAFSNSEIKEQQVLYGVDNVQMPNDSLMLMNSLLVDYQVDYDIALATKNPNEIVSALHKIGLVYLKLEQFDLASNYGWRLLNVSTKYELDDYQLYAYALLYRVNKDSGNANRANNMFQAYQRTLSIVNEDTFHKQMELDAQSMQSEVDITQSEQTAQQVTPPLKLANIEKEAKLVDIPYVVFLGVISLIGVWLFFQFVKSKNNSSPSLLEVASVSVQDVEHTEIKDELVATKLQELPNEVLTEKPPVEFSKEKTVNKTIRKEEATERTKASQFQKLQDQLANIFSDQKWDSNVSVIGNFKDLSENTYSGLLYIIESVTQNTSTQSNKSMSMQWVEVPKGMVLNLTLPNDLWLWNQKYFDEWVGQVFEKYQIMITQKPNANHQIILVIKKYY